MIQNRFIKQQFNNIINQNQLNFSERQQIWDIYNNKINHLIENKESISYQSNHQSNLFQSFADQNNHLPLSPTSSVQFYQINSDQSIQFSFNSLNQSSIEIQIQSTIVFSRIQHSIIFSIFISFLHAKNKSKQWYQEIGKIAKTLRNCMKKSLLTYSKIKGQQAFKRVRFLYKILFNQLIHNHSSNLHSTIKFIIQEFDFSYITLVFYELWKSNQSQQYPQSYYITKQKAQILKLNNLSQQHLTFLLQSLKIQLFLVQNDKTGSFYSCDSISNIEIQKIDNGYILSKLKLNKN